MTPMDRGEDASSDLTGLGVRSMLVGFLLPSFKTVTWRDEPGVVSRMSAINFDIASCEA